MSTTRKSKFVKKSEQFKESEEENVKYQSILEMGLQGGKSIFKKIPVSEKDFTRAGSPKFQAPWLRKPVSKNEIISSEGFRILLGEQCSPKYRIYLNKDGETFTITKLLDHFTPWVHQIKKMPDLSEEEAKSFNFCGDHQSPYGKIFLKYLKATSVLDNFNRMIAVCLLFGKNDIHTGNWGVVDVDGKQYAATVDHEEAIREGFNLYDVLYKYRHRKERFLTTEFVSACRQVITDFDSNRTLLHEKMSGCADDFRLHQLDSLSIDYVICVLEKNKIKLMNLTYQIEAEMAIVKGDVAAMRLALQSLPTNYFPEDIEEGIRSLFISMQNYRDGYISSSGMNFRTLIQRRKFIDCDIFDPERDELSVEDLKKETELLSVYDDVARAKLSQKSTSRSRYGY